MSEKIIAFANTQRDAYLNDLMEFLSIPSVSAQPKHERDVKYAALWLSEHLRDIGLRANVMETNGHPVVFAEWSHSDPHRPTVLIYGHYDVQPAEPFELWHSQPFQPEVRDGIIYARGSSDNKGQIMAHIKAVESYLKHNGTLPVSIKFLIEGEEEIGSAHLEDFVAANKDLLSCSVVMISDGSLLSRDQAALVYGLRGLVYLEVEARCAAHDLHSGTYGGNVQNPVMALASILAQLKDRNGHITVPGFYDGVRALSIEERADLAGLPINEGTIMAESGASSVFGEPEYSVMERMGARPTLEINGLWGGYTGHGAKTVLPALAHAKLSCRLVPYQDPQKVYDAVTSYMRHLTPAGTILTFQSLQRSARGTLIDRDAPQVQAAIRAAEATYGRKPLFALEGGSIPVVNSFQDELGCPIVLLGFGLPGDNAHAPDEHYPVWCYEKGIEASIRFLAEL